MCLSFQRPPLSLSLGQREPRVADLCMFSGFYTENLVHRLCYGLGISAGLLIPTGHENIDITKTTTAGSIYTEICLLSNADKTA